MDINNNNEVVIRVEHDVIGGAQQTGGINKGVSAAIPQEQAQKQFGFTGAISAQLFVSGISQVINATGNQQVGRYISQGAEYGFLSARALSGDVTAIATMAFKLAALGIQKINEYRVEQKELAQKYNELMSLQLQSGQIVITANTVSSYDKWGRVTFKERK